MHVGRFHYDVTESLYGRNCAARQDEEVARLVEVGVCRFPRRSSRICLLVVLPNFFSHSVPAHDRECKRSGDDDGEQQPSVGEDRGSYALLEALPAALDALDDGGEHVSDDDLVTMRCQSSGVCVLRVGGDYRKLDFRIRY